MGEKERREKSRHKEGLEGGEERYTPKYSHCCHGLNVASFLGSPLGPTENGLCFYFPSGRGESLGTRLA